MKVTTKYTTNASGAGRIVAKGHGKQKTVPYDHADSVDGNHAVAVAALIAAHGRNDLAGAVVESIDAGEASVLHTSPASRTYNLGAMG